MSSDLPVACTVRGCTLALRRRDRMFVCDRGHSYDIARTGYVNLLQPQDRRSRAAGDPSAAVDARASLLSAGIGRAVIDALAIRAANLDLGGSPVVVDLGCGSGDALAALSENRTGIGIDLSLAAIERAARRFPAHTWIVANADRRLPLLDHSVDLVVSLHGRRNPSEVSRVLATSRHLLVAVPAPDDLMELRELVQGQRIERDRVGPLLADHESLFQLIERSVVRENVELDREGLQNLLTGTYRGVRHAAAERFATLTRLNVTLASELLLLAPRT